jgi:hypothetical protein
MSRKIIGVTVGTPISPSKIEAELKPVKTVNGVEPDESGNVEITISGSGGNVGDAILYTPQTPTEEQKAHARNNIGAVTLDEVLAALPVGEGVRY